MTAKKPWKKKGLVYLLPPVLQLLMRIRIFGAVYKNAKGVCLGVMRGHKILQDGGMKHLRLLFTSNKMDVYSFTCIRQN